MSLQLQYLISLYAKNIQRKTDDTTMSHITWVILVRTVCSTLLIYNKNKTILAQKLGSAMFNLWSIHLYVLVF